MPDHHLVAYIKKELHAGTEESELITHLSSLNWKQDDIHEAIVLAKGYHNQPLTRSTPATNNLQHQPSYSLLTKNAISFTAILLIQALVGIDWLVSSLAKILSPDYQTEFSRQVQSLASSSPLPLISNVLTNTVLPNYSIFSYLLEFCEVLIGAALVITSLLAYFQGDIRGARPLVASLATGSVISIASFLAADLPIVPSFGIIASNLFMALVQLVLLAVLIARTYPSKN
jgi:hypothetical protein